MAEAFSRFCGWAIAEAGVTVNGQSAGVLPVLVFGAGTDYALLLVARYREELRRHDSPVEAMRQALRRAGPAVVASGSTVIVALLCLSLAEVNGTSGLGPDRRHGRGAGDARDAHAAAGWPGHRRPTRLLALHPPLRLAGRRRDARVLAAGRRTRRRPSPPRLGHHGPTARGGLSRGRELLERADQHPGLPWRRRIRPRPAADREGLPGRVQRAQRCGRPRPGGPARRAARRSRRAGRGRGRRHRARTARQQDSR